MQRWDFQLARNSNGVDPANEPVIIAVGEEGFRIPAGRMTASRSGKRFTYKDQTDRGVRVLRLLLGADGVYRVRFSLAGVDMSRLLLLDRPAVECLPFAVIIGDDDGFSGVKFMLPKPSPSTLLTIPTFCADVASWPWA